MSAPAGRRKKQRRRRRSGGARSSPSFGLLRLYRRDRGAPRPEKQVVAPLTFKEWSRLEFYFYGVILCMSLFALYHFISDNQGRTNKQRRRRRNRNTADLRLDARERVCDPRDYPRPRRPRRINGIRPSLRGGESNKRQIERQMEERTEDNEHLSGGRGVSGELRRRKNRDSTAAALSRHTTDGEASGATQESVEGWSVGSPAGLSLLDGCDSCGASPRNSDGSPPHVCMVSPSPPNSPRAQASCIILLSKGVCDYRQRANQNATCHALNDFAIPHTLVDGMDQTQVAAREALFQISGIRGNYPQLFLKSSVSGDSVYLGGHEWLTSGANLQDLKRRCCAGGENEEDEDLYGWHSGAATLGSSSLAQPRFAILVSTGVFDLEQRANQASALRLLRGLDIDYEIVDGMDPAQKDRRDAFFAISGHRGYYPQVFFDQTHYLGGYEYLRGLQKELAQRQGE